MFHSLSLAAAFNVYVPFVPISRFATLILAVVVVAVTFTEFNLIVLPGPEILTEYVAVTFVP